MIQAYRLYFNDSVYLYYNVAIDLSECGWGCVSDLILQPAETTAFIHTLKKIVFRCLPDILNSTVIRPSF